MIQRREPLPRPAGWAVFGVLVIFTAGGIAHRVPDDVLLGALAGVGVIVFGALAILGRPGWLVPATLAATAAVAVLGNGTASSVAWFGIPVLAAWCAMTTALPVVLGYWAGALLLIGGEWVFATPDPGWGAWLGGTCFSVVGCYFGSRQHDLNVQLREAQAGLAARAQAEERNRIARELHDVIAHSLTVSLLHVSSARLALADAPDEAARALDEAERLGRQSLDEVRHAVGLLREGNDKDPTAPLPGSLDVPALLDRFRGAGTDVRASVDGDLAAVPGTVGLATYRILQEALTNAVKHAPHATATVRVAVAKDAVRLSVDSAGAPKRGTGLGLIGMRERAESLGGTCSAGPGGAGWLVQAELPL
ncbi:MAG TPA: sensor histidine kinase [Jatrophihabitans sp.]|nr:sensor histidine kinase [Jatrophihabitans sp.]